MKAWQSRILWVISILGILLTLVVEFLPQKDAVEQLLSIPTADRSFRSQETPLTDQERELLGDASAIKKVVYPHSGDPFLFSAIDGSRNRHAVHDPRYCFVGSGWKIMGEQSLETRRGTVQSLILERDGEQRHALFWFSTPDQWFVSPISFWGKATARRLTFGLAGEEPILLVVQSLGDQPLTSPATLEILETLDPWK
ncbi:MAG: exosortase-associated EpsI family protein [Verrucomicrobiota bacterium]